MFTLLAFPCCCGHSWYQRDLIGLPLTWRYMVESLIRSNQVKKAFVLIDQMLRDGVEFLPVLMNVIVSHVARKGYVQLYEKRFGPLPKERLKLPYFSLSSPHSLLRITLTLALSVGRRNSGR